jgi:hypothetical protein
MYLYGFDCYIIVKRQVADQSSSDPGASLKLQPNPTAVVSHEYDMLSPKNTARVVSLLA